MRQVFQKSYVSADLCIEEVPAPVLKGEGVIVQNRASLISPGTERATVSFARKGMIAKIQSQPERVKLLLRKMKQVGVLETLQLARRKLEAPIALGYSSAGVVTEVSPGLPGVKRGDRVACAGAKYANHAEMVYVPKNLCVPLPENLSFEEGSFVAPGAIALHGVRLAEIGLGETVVIIGLGLIGQLTAQLVTAQGGIAIGIDFDPARLKLAQELGCKHAFRRSDAGLLPAVQALTEGYGADKVLITAATASSDPIILAGELARERAKVVVVGDVGMEVPRSLYYHKELSVIVSRSYGPGRYDEAYEEHGQAYPRAYVRWSERENMAAFLHLVSEGKVRLQPLMDARYPVEEAGKAYDILTNPEIKPQPLGILLQYPESARPAERRLSLPVAGKPADPMSGSISLGVIGAGNFLRTQLLPAFKRCGKDAYFAGIASQSGLTAKSTGQEFGFAYCATDPKELFKDPAISAVVIGTRHDSHAPLLCEALKHGKHVFVEKPLATTQAELQECIDAAQNAPEKRVMVGFNRRFAPMTKQVKTLLDASSVSRPLTIHYRVSAGPIPPESWLHQHGGRLIGEGCHFIDWCLYLTGEWPTSVTAHRVGEGVNHDIAIQLTFSGGSVAHILYMMRSDAALGKEKIEVHSPSLVAEIDDFKTLRYQQNGKVQQARFGKPEKGIPEGAAAFIQALKTGAPSPIPFAQLVATTATTLAVCEALETARPVTIPVFDEC